MKKKNDDKSAIEAYMKKRGDMSDSELNEEIKGMSDEALVKTLLAMLRKDQNRAAYLFQHLNEVIRSSAAMGREGYQPIAMLTLYARESGGVTEFKFRPARTGSEQVYRSLKLKRFFELVNDAWVQYGNELFGDMGAETEVDMSSLNAWAKAVEDQEETESR